MVTLEGEVPLIGGRVTAGVVRVENTVRRPAMANSNFVRRLLDHLAARNFEGAPSFLGTDERGRDIFAFIDGEVPSELSHYDDETLRAAASLIRRFHDLSAELVATPAAQAVGIEVICHNDLSPCNFVFRAGVPSAMIDFDAAAPGSRLHDLGYAAWLWLDLGSPAVTASEQKRRLAVFVDTYGMYRPDSILSAALERQAILVAKAHRIGDLAMAQWATECFEWTRRYACP